MRICVLEWIHGGGVHRCRPEEVPVGLREEGWAMLECLCHEFFSAGHEVFTIIDGRLVSEWQWQTLSSHGIGVVGFAESHSHSAPDSDASTALDVVLECWRRLAVTCDLTLVVAPEINGILHQCITELVDCGVRVLNCTGGFLRAASDKRLTAELLVNRKIPHPETWTAKEFPVDQLMRAERWCVKPRWGAGCEGLRIYHANQLKLSLPQIRGQPHSLIQPWVEGGAFSMSAAIDFEGQVHWSPLVTQELIVEKPSESWETLCYRGAKLVDNCVASSDLSEMLGATLDALGGFRVCGQLQAAVSPSCHLDLDKSATGKRPAGRREALGWVGFDLVLDNRQQWTVIEVNARLTTSVVLLCRCGRVQLAKQVLRGYNQGQIGCETIDK